MLTNFQHIRNVFVGAVALAGIASVFSGCSENDHPVPSDPSPGGAAHQEAPSPEVVESGVPPRESTSRQVAPLEVEPSEVLPGKEPASDDPPLARYRAAMRIAEGRADPSGKGKDVLGPGSPWKLNLYDDDKDGQWDRGKLDYDRDEVDDEKWNFKKGRWEKDGGARIWDGSHWIGAGE